MDIVWVIFWFLVMYVKSSTLIVYISIHVYYCSKYKSNCQSFNLPRIYQGFSSPKDTVRKVHSGRIEHGTLAAKVLIHCGLDLFAVNGFDYEGTAAIAEMTICRARLVAIKRTGRGGLAYYSRVFHTGDGVFQYYEDSGVGKSAYCHMITSFVSTNRRLTTRTILPATMFQHQSHANMITAGVPSSLLQPSASSTRSFRHRNDSVLLLLRVIGCNSCTRRRSSRARDNE